MACAALAAGMTGWAPQQQKALQSDLVVEEPLRKPQQFLRLGLPPGTHGQPAVKPRLSGLPGLAALDFQGGGDIHLVVFFDQLLLVLRGQLLKIPGRFFDLWDSRQAL